MYIYTYIYIYMYTYVHIYMYVTMRLASYGPPTISQRYSKVALTLELKGIAHSQVSCHP